MKREKQQPTASRSPKPKSGIYFPKYISQSEVETGLKNRTLFKGRLKIRKFLSEAYVANEDPSQLDYIITSVFDRNRALDNDEVVIKIKNVREDGRKEAEVVDITKMVHPREAIGFLKSASDKRFAYITPRDERIPFINIPKNYWPKNFEIKPDHYKNILFIAKITKWEKEREVQGEIIEELGPAGILKTENLTLLHEFRINPYVATELKVELSEMVKYREDLREKCVFTVDNSDTVDMDDALSCQELPNGNYELGVHIADVSHFVKEGTKIDNLARKKGKSIYLEDKCYGMLPDDLSALCAFSPHEDKRTFSLFWEITPDGEIIEKRFAKSVINSCAQLSYEHAQLLIDEDFNQEDLPQIHNGFSTRDLSKALIHIQKLALLLRDRRTENCGIQENRPSFYFNLDPITGEPLTLLKEATIPTNDLVEELMILTNATVAERIYDSFPELAFLRVHEPPNNTKLLSLKQRLESIGIRIDVRSAKRIVESIDKYASDDNFGETYGIVLHLLINKCNQKEKYVCSGMEEEKANLKHYGLDLPLYTHFTSPIRRYADIISHRLLAASLNYVTEVTWTPQDISDAANDCNQRNNQTKLAQNASFDLYLSYFVDRNQPFVQDAGVYQVNEKSFDVITLSTRRCFRVYADDRDANWEFQSEKNDSDEWKIDIKFPKIKKSLTIEIFTVVQIRLIKIRGLNKLKAILHAS